MTQEDRVMELVQEYAHEHWASDRTINRKEDEESQAEMSRIEAEIRKLVEESTLGAQLETWKRLYKESQAGLGVLGEQLETARKDNEILNGMVTAHYDALKQYESQLKTARKALGEVKNQARLGLPFACYLIAEKALAQIDAGQKAQESK